MFKTSKLARFLNQNMLRIIIALLAIAFAIILVQGLNYITKMQKQGNATNQIDNQITFSSLDTSSETVISGQQVETEVNDQNEEVVEQFITYCNHGNIEEAYQMLTDSCKEVYYKDLDSFRRLYYQVVFSNTKTYSLQSWINSNNVYTYKVKIMDDMLSSGSYNTENIIEDYYTIYYDEMGQAKLSINSYVGNEVINQSVEKENIQITIVEKQMYIDYEIYTISIKNNSEFTIALDSKENLDSTYLWGEEVKYSSYIDEVSMDDLIIFSKEEKQIQIKFNKMYDPDRNIETIVFENIIKNYDIYTALNNKSKYGGRLKIEISV